MNNKMIKSAKIAQPLIVELENESKLFFLDPINNKIFDENLNEVSTDEKNMIFNSIYEQETAYSPMPLDKIQEVMTIEKKLTKENDKHIFRRN